MPDGCAAAGLPDAPLVQFHLALTYAALEQTDKALERFRHLAGMAGAGTLTAAAGPEPQGGLSLTLGLRSLLRVSDTGNGADSSGAAAGWDNRLSMGVLSETDADRFGLDLAGTLRFGGDGGFGDPAPTLDDGTRQDRHIALSFETGPDGPPGFGLMLQQTARDYSGVTDPGLFAAGTGHAEVFTRIRLSPVIKGRFDLFPEDDRADDAGQGRRRTDDIRLDLAGAPDPVTVFEAMIGHRDIAPRATPPGVAAANRRGAIGALRMRRELAGGGSVGLSLAHDLTVTGQRDKLVIDRVPNLPGGTFSVRLGIARNPSGDTGVTGGLTYTHTLPDGALTASAERRFATSSDGEDIRATRLALGYETAFNALSALSLDLYSVTPKF